MPTWVLVFYIIGAGSISAPPMVPFQTEVACKQVGNAWKKASKSARYVCLKVESN